MTSEKSSTDAKLPEEVIKNYKDLDQKVEAILDKIKKKKIIKTAKATKKT